jgi:hypothetical protein
MVCTKRYLSRAVMPPTRCRSMHVVPPGQLEISEVQWAVGQDWKLLMVSSMSAAQAMARTCRTCNAAGK